MAVVVVYSPTPSSSLPQTGEIAYTKSDQKGSTPEAITFSKATTKEGCYISSCSSLYMRAKLWKDCNFPEKMGYIIQRIFEYVIIPLFNNKITRAIFCITKDYLIIPLNEIIKKIFNKILEKGSLPLKTKKCAHISSSSVEWTFDNLFNNRVLLFIRQKSAFCFNYLCDKISSFASSPLTAKTCRLAKDYLIIPASSLLSKTFQAILGRDSRIAKIFKACVNFLSTSSTWTLRLIFSNRVSLVIRKTSKTLLTKLFKKAISSAEYWSSGLLVGLVSGANGKQQIETEGLEDNNHPVHHTASSGIKFFEPTDIITE